MDQPSPAPQNNPAPQPTPPPPVPSSQSTPPPATGPAPAQMSPPAPGKSSSPWPWIIGGCLAVIIITALAVFLLGWWGVRTIKKEINNQTDKYEPTLEGVKENLDKLTEEGEEWEKKSKEIREAIPDAEELQKEMENDYPNYKK